MKVICQYCKKEADKVTGAFLYPHTESVAHKMFYVCEPCDARVGCHPKSDTPLGSLANYSLRKRRNYAHNYLDRLWKEGYMERSECYLWLAFAIGIPIKFAHIAMFNEEQCLEVVDLSKAKLLEYIDESDVRFKRKQEKTDIQEGKPSVSLFRGEE